MPMIDTESFIHGCSAHLELMAFVDLIMASVIVRCQSPIAPPDGFAGLQACARKTIVPDDLR